MKETTFIVSKDGNGNFTTINEALNAAKDGYTIIVNGGAYNEKIAIDKKVSIIGDANDRPLVMVKDGIACSINAEASLEYIDLRSDAKDGDEYNNEKQDAVLEINADASLYNCSISSYTSNGIHVNKNSNTVISNCDIYIGELKED